MESLGSLCPADLELRPGVKAKPHSCWAVLAPGAWPFFPVTISPECVSPKVAGTCCASPSSDSSPREAHPGKICGAGHAESFTRLGVG